MSAALNLYDQDFYAWTQEQAKLIKEKSFDKLDFTHLFDEVECMGASEVRELESRLEVLLTHLLKWKYQPPRRGTSWELTIKEQRKRIEKRLKKMPSLKSIFDEAFMDAYEVATYEAAKATKLSLKAFPSECEWTIEQALDNDFYPS